MRHIENLDRYTKIYSQKGDLKEAAHYRLVHKMLQDSVYNIAKLRQLENAHFTYELGERTRVIDLLNQESVYKDLQLEIRNKWLFIVVSLLVVVFVMLLVFIRQKRKLMSAYHKLFEQNIQLINGHNYRDFKLSKTSNNDGHDGSDEQDNVACNIVSNICVVSGDKSLCGEEHELESEVSSGNSKISGERRNELLKAIEEVMKQPELFCNPDFSTVMLASLINSNNKYVSQIINETYNKKFRNFVNEYRIKEAQIRILDVENYGNYTIQSIAESVGYKSYPNFVAVFKDLTGLTPSMFKQMSEKNIANS